MKSFNRSMLSNTLLSAVCRATPTTAFIGTEFDNRIIRTNSISMLNYYYLIVNLPAHAQILQNKPNIEKTFSVSLFANEITKREQNMGFTLLNSIYHINEQYLGSSRELTTNIHSVDARLIECAPVVLECQLSKLEGVAREDGEDQIIVGKIIGVHVLESLLQFLLKRDMGDGYYQIFKQSVSSNTEQISWASICRNNGDSRLMRAGC